LPTAWRLARQQGGDIRFESNGHEPTRFVLTLPAAKPDPEPRGNAHAGERNGTHLLAQSGPGNLEA
jgi:hypothetical protein